MILNKVSQLQTYGAQFVGKWHSEIVKCNIMNTVCISLQTAAFFTM